MPYGRPETPDFAGTWPSQPEKSRAAQDALRSVRDVKADLAQGAGNAGGQAQQPGARGKFQRSFACWYSGITRSEYAVRSRMRSARGG